MKKRIFAVAFVISVIIGLSTCKNSPIFAAIEQEVKLNPASVKGLIRGIVEISNTLYASNGKIYYKAKGNRGKWSEMSGCPSGLCTGLAADDTNKLLYAAFGQGDTFTIHKYDTTASSWSKVSGVTAQSVIGTNIVFAIKSEESGKTTTYTISTIENGAVSSTWSNGKFPVGAAREYCLLEDGLYDKTGAKVAGCPSSGLKGICEGPSSSVFVFDNSKLYCYDGSAWTDIKHKVSTPQSITYLPSKQLVLISGIKGFGEIKLAGADLTGAQSIQAGSTDSSVPPANIHQYNNSVGKYTINLIKSFDTDTGYIVYVGVNDPNAKYTGLWGLYKPERIEWNRE